MTITREQVADLREGDVVELSDDRWPQGTVLRGPLWLDADSGYIRCAASYIRHTSGDHLPPMTEDIRRHRSITVVSRAPRPLYVNHPRTEPVPGDVVRDADEDSVVTYNRCVDAVGIHAWRTTGGVTWLTGDREADLPKRLRLLVDGETGQVVP